MTRRRAPPVLHHAPGRAARHIVARLRQGRMLDLRMIETLLTPQCHLRIGNDAPSLGRDRVVRDLARFVREAEGLGTGYLDAWRCRSTVIVELDCVMTRPDGCRATVPCSAILRLSGGQVDDIRIYIERSGLPSVTA